MLTFFSFLLGEDHDLLTSMDHKSRARVITLMSLVIIPMGFAAFATWFIAGMMGASALVCLMASATIGFVIFLLDRSLVQAAAPKKKAIRRARVAFSFISALLCSIAVDTCVFHEDLAPIVAELRAEQVDNEIAARTVNAQQRIADQRTDVARLRGEAQRLEAEFRAEMDGTGGSGNGGYGKIAAQKKALAEEATSRLNKAEVELTGMLRALDDNIADIQADRANSGLLLHVKASWILVSNSLVASIVWLLLFSACVLMEMMFLLWKKYSPPTAYEVAIAELEEQHKARVRLAQMRREAREARQQNFSALGHLVDQELSQLN